MVTTESEATPAAPRRLLQSVDCPMCGGERVVDGVLYIAAGGTEREITACPVCTGPGVSRVGPDVIPAVDVRPGDIIDTSAGARLVESRALDAAKGLVALHLAGTGAPVLSVGAGAEITVLHRRDPFRSWSA